MLKSFVAESGHPIALRQLPVVRFGRTKSKISSPTFRGGWRRDVAEPKNCCLEDYAMFFLIRGIYLRFVFQKAWWFFSGIFRVSRKRGVSWRKFEVQTKCASSVYCGFSFLGADFCRLYRKTFAPMDLYYTLEIDHLIKVSFRNVMSSIRQFILMVCSSNP